MARRYLIVTPFADAETVASILHLRSVDAHVVPTASGVVIVRDLPDAPVFDDWDMSELLGLAGTEAPAGDALDGADATDVDAVDRNVSDAVDATDVDARDSDSLDSDDGESVAAMLSRLSDYGVVYMSAELGDDVGLEAGTSGLVSAVRFLQGRKGEEIPAGLIINSVDPMIERLILGSIQADEATAAIASRDVSRSKLARLFQRRGDRKDVPRGNAAIRRDDDDEQS